MFERKKDEPGGSDDGNEGAFPFKTSKKPLAATTSHRADAARRVNESGATPRRFERRNVGDTDSKKLTVGRDIRLKGEITSCDKLIVEGSVEATLNQARAIEVAASGHFKGDAQVDEADISGVYEGQLIARSKLTVRAGGRVSGSIRYGRIVIESGGEIAGDMQTLSPAEAGSPDDEGAAADGEARGESAD
jgi:cytoskeletal protein CcmA (bactofilin family)